MMIHYVQNLRYYYSWHIFKEANILKMGKNKMLITTGVTAVPMCTQICNANWEGLDNFFAQDLRKWEIL